MNEWMTAGPENVSQIVKNLEMIQKGEDSEVYRWGMKALKRYPSLPLEQIQLYREATGQVTRFMKGKRMLSGKIQIPLLVNPINEIIVSATNHEVFTLSPFIEGGNPQDQLNSRLLSQPEFNKLESFFEDVTRETTQNVPYWGIHIIPWNVTFQPTPNSIQGVITDICWRVRELRRK